MPYQVDLSDESRRDVSPLPGHIRQRTRRMIAGLEAEPRPVGAKGLRDQPGLCRQRLDRSRVIYRIRDDELLVIVLAVCRKTGPETYEHVEP